MGKRKQTGIIVDTLSRKWKKTLKRLSSKKERKQVSGDLAKHRLYSEKYDDQCYQFIISLCVSMLCHSCMATN